MKKLSLVIAAMIGMSAVIGCTPEQQSAVAKQLGIASAVTWIGIDNPDAEDIETVKSIVGIIKSACCVDCTDDSSYYARVYPVVDQYITEKIEANKQPMARLGASFVLTSLDTAFAMNPKWKANADTATMMIEAYCDGVETGLSLAATDPIRIAATRQVSLRVSTLKLKK